MENYNDKTWTEIFLAGFFIALVWWIIHNWMNNKPKVSTNTNTNTNTIPNEIAPTSVPAFGIPPIILPNGTSNSNCDCSNNCAAGTISPGISQIIANTNSALAAIQSGGIQTIKKLAGIGSSEGYANFIVG